MAAGGSVRGRNRSLRARRLLLLTAAGLIGLLGLSGCGTSGDSGNSGSGPAVVGTLTDAPDTGQAGIGRAGNIMVPKGSYVRLDHQVSLRLDISNTGATPDQLVQVASNVGAAGTLTPNPLS